MVTRTLPRQNDAITDIAGIRVGHWTDRRAATGCTVVLCEKGAVAGIDVRGGAPGTRESSLLRPETLVQQIHAVFLTGGSAFGLDVGSGIMRYLEERGVGFAFAYGGATVPIVCGAVLFDLNVGRADVRPTAESGYRACLSAKSGRVAEGSVGAGTGATVAKVRTVAHGLKGGIGCAAERIDGLVVAALVAVNAFGEISDGETVIAGPRGAPGRLDSTLDIMRRAGPSAGPPLTNTTIGVIATNATLTKVQATAVAHMAHDGIARAVRPAHSPVDGDVLFALATCEREEPASVLTVGAFAACAVERAIVRAVRAATGLAGVPSAAEWLAKGR